MTIMDVVEARIQSEARTKAEQDAKRFEADLLMLTKLYGVDDFSRIVSSPAVSAYIKVRADMLADERREAIVQGLFAGVQAQG